MRLSKTKVDEGDHEDGLDWNRLKRKVMREVVFANNYLVPLLGLEYVGKVQAIQLKLEQVSILNHKLKKCRPSTDFVISCVYMMRENEKYNCFA